MDDLVDKLEKLNLDVEPMEIVERNVQEPDAQEPPPPRTPRAFPPVSRELLATAWMSAESSIESLSPLSMELQPLQLRTRSHSTLEFQQHFHGCQLRLRVGNDTGSINWRSDTTLELALGLQGA